MTDKTAEKNQKEEADKAEETKAVEAAAKDVQDGADEAAEAERWKKTTLWLLKTQYPGHAIAHAHLRLGDYNPPQDVRDVLTEAVMELQVEFRS